MSLDHIIMPANSDRVNFGRYIAAHWWIPLTGILVLTAAAYASTLAFGFVYDDLLQIVSSPQIRSWGFLPRYFTTHVWNDHFASSAYYRPLFVLWLLVNYKLFGLVPWCWHLTTIAAHLACTVVLYIVAFRLSKNRGTAATAAVLFGLNPVHVEAVAWVSGVTEPLLALFFVGSLLYYINSRQPETTPAVSRRRWAVSLALYAGALLEKETAVVLPLFIFAYDWLYGDSLTGPLATFRTRAAARFRSALDAATPYLLTTLGYLALRAIILHKVIGVRPLPFAWPYMLCFYLKRLVWPVNLSVFYSVPPLAGPTLESFWGPLAVLVIVAVTLFWLGKQSRLVAFCSVWIVLPLLPTLNVILGQDDLVHDRYLYLPSMAASLLFAMGIGRLRVSQARVFGQPLAQVVVITVVALLFSAGVAREGRYWKNNFLLFEHAGRTAPGNINAKYSSATGYWAIGMQQKAIAILLDVVQRRPDFYLANAAVGQLYYDQGLFERAEAYLNRAIELQPKESKTPYVYLGLAQMRMGRLDEAEALLRRAMTIDTMDRDNPFIHSALAAVLKRKGDLRGALAEFRLEEALAPDTRAVRHEIAVLEARLRGADGLAGSNDRHVTAAGTKQALDTR